MKATIIIPARYNSSRLPGKPLAMIAGQTMLQRVYNVAKKAAESINHAEVDVLIATEDERILKHAEEIGAKAIMTPDTCESGTDRALEAISLMKEKPDFIINLQGDAPLTPPDFIADVLREFINNKNLQVVTPVEKLSWAELDLLREHKKETPFSGTTVVLNKENDAIWFSKNIIPAIRGEEILREENELSPVYRHIGLYGYSLSVLEDFAKLSMSHYEVLEGLEQLRLLENGYKIRAIIVDYKGRPAISGIDSPEDIFRAEALIDKMRDV